MNAGSRPRAAALHLLATAWALGACPSAPSTKADDASTSGAVARSAADFCEEHGVLESLCTKCNPALVPVFRARGDFCEEHALPLSICPIHHPERAGRPASAVEGEDGPAEGTQVRFQTKATAQLAGILTTTVVAQPVETRVTAPTRIRWHPSHHAQLNARAAGVVRELRVDLGEQVEPGGVLAVLQSASVGGDAGALRAATSRVGLATARLDRARNLRADGIAATQDVLAAQQEVEDARAAEAAAQAQLAMVDADGDSAGTYALHSPLGGVVVGRNLSVGQFVDTDAVLFVVADPSVVVAELDIAEHDLPAIRTGTAVSIELDAMPGRTWTGTLASLSPEIDPRSRTAQGRVLLPNPDGQLRAQSFGTASLSTSAPREALMVPRAAVQRAGTRDMVFVRLASDLFEVRRVRVGAASGELVEVEGALRAGDAVASTGSFLLKTETLRDSIGAGCCAED